MNRYQQLLNKTVDGSLVALCVGTTYVLTFLVGAVYASLTVVIIGIGIQWVDAVLFILKSISQ